MSQFTGAHTLSLFDAKSSKALNGQRLAKCRYKTTAANPAKYPSACVSVPFIPHSSIKENVSRLLPYIQSMLENAQDGVIRSLYESRDGTLGQVSDQDISIDACIGFMEAESTGGRLTKEFIDAWFVSAVHDTLYVIIADKLHYSGTLTPEQEVTVEKHINGYKGMYSSLAGGKTFYQPGQVKSLRKVLELVDSDDTSAKLDARLAKMLEVKPIEELLEL